MKTGTKILLGVAAAGAIGAYAYRSGVNNVQFSLDGYQLAPDGAGLLMRIKATNPNKFFGYPVPQALINVFDNNSNFLGTAINNQLQYIPANSTSFIYAVVQPNYQNLVSVITGIITSGLLPTNLIFNGIVKVGPIQIPFDTGASIGSVKRIDLSEAFEEGTPAIYHRIINGNHTEEAGEVVVRDGVKYIKLYPNRNYAGREEILIFPYWQNVETFYAANKRQKQNELFKIKPTRFSQN
jgi:hypothetical protein